MAQFGYVNSTFGDNGQIIRVTTTAPGGPGSLREALETNGPRTIVFECAGVFRLDAPGARPSANVVYLGQGRGDLSVYGQTAPGPVVIVGSLRLNTHDALFQHVTIFGLADSDAPECVDVLGNSTQGSRRIVFDHCSFYRGYSKAFQTWAGEPGRFTGNEGGVDGLTIQDCIFAEPLLGPKATRYLAILQEKTTNAAFIRCLFAGATMRHPAVHDASESLIQNCYVFDAGEAAIHLMVSPVPTGPTRTTIVGNVIQAGPGTVADGDRILVNAIPGSEVYLADNAGRRDPRLVTPGVVTKSPPLPIVSPLLVSSDVPAYVLANAGPTPWQRSPHDTRVIERVRAGASRRADTNDAWDGLPGYLPATRPLGEITDLTALLQRFEPTVLPHVDTATIQSAVISIRGRLDDILGALE